VGLVVGIDQALSGDVGVNLGGRQAPVAEEILDTPEIGPTVEEVGGETVPERVRARGWVQPLGFEITLENPANAPGGQSTAALVEEQGWLCGLAWPAERPPAGDPLHRHRTRTMPDSSSRSSRLSPTSSLTRSPPP
jgi:hypothetical protein